MHSLHEVNTYKAKRQDLGVIKGTGEMRLMSPVEGNRLMNPLLFRHDELRYASHIT